MLDEFALTDDRTIKILSDPLRQKVLRSLIDHGPQTSSGVSRLLGLAASKVHYHLGKLESVGLIELDHEEIINGIQARFMRPVARSFTMNTDTIRRHPSTQNAVLQLARAELNRVYGLLEDELSRPESSDAILLLSQLRLTPADARALEVEFQDLLTRWGALTRDRPSPEGRTWRLLLAAVPERGE